MKNLCCLFTCLTTRALQIDVVPIVEADACLAAITIIMARGGELKIMFRIEAREVCEIDSSLELIGH